MPSESSPVFSILVLVFPHYNLAATTAFIDPFRAANYLSGHIQFHWQLVSMEGGPVVASNGIGAANRG